MTRLGVPDVAGPAAQNPLHRLKALGQSPWLDDIRRNWLIDGSLPRLIAEDGVSGVTSNPAILATAIAEGSEYKPAIAALARLQMSSEQRYEALVVQDICGAADLLLPAYSASGGGDGYVSLEVSPLLAHDTERTVLEGERLWRLVARPNLMIKIPATVAGLAAIRRLTAVGINVNATLIFSVSRYLEVADAYLSGLEDRLRTGATIEGLASVASFFISRIDTHVDRLLANIPGYEARTHRGRTAIACARLAYREYQLLVEGSRWGRLAARGGQPQRLLWASTSTKDPAYRDVLYVDALIGANTVNTMPLATLLAYRDHGQPIIRIDEDLAGCIALPQQLTRLGIDLQAVAQCLEEEGIARFAKAYSELLAAVSTQTRR